MRKIGGISGFRVSTFALVWLVGCVALAGCGETDHDDDGGGPSSAPVEANDFAARFAGSYCGSIGACCERFDETFELGDCTSVTESYLRAAIQTQLVSSKVVFDEAVAGRCIEAYGVALEACTDREKGDALDVACEGLFRGTVPLGQACTEGIECQSSAGEYVSCSSGVCTAEEDYFDLFDAPPAALGEPCGGTCDYESGSGGSCYGSAQAVVANACWLEDGLVCEAGVCEPAPVLGETCSSYCAGDSHCTGGTCVARIATGPCPTGDECTASSFCYYAGVTGTGECTPRKADGETCDQDDECLGGACEGDRCRAWSVASAESCAGLFDD